MKVEKERSKAAKGKTVKVTSENNFFDLSKKKKRAVPIFKEIKEFKVLTPMQLSQHWSGGIHLQKHSGIKIVGPN